MHSLKDVQYSLSVLERLKDSLTSSPTRAVSRKEPISQKQMEEVLKALEELSETYSKRATKERIEQESTARLISLIHDLKIAADNEQAQQLLGAIQQSFLQTITRVENVLQQWEIRYKKVRGVENEGIRK